MANETNAQAQAAPDRDGYAALLAALSESARGRAFLAEHARRSRDAETERLLETVERLEGLLGTQETVPPAHDFDALLDLILDVRAEIGAGTLAMKVAKLTTLLDVVQRRIEASMGAKPAAIAQTDAPSDTTGPNTLSAHSHSPIETAEPVPISAHSRASTGTTEPIPTSVHSRIRVQPSAGPSTGSSGNPEPQLQAQQLGAMDPRLRGDERDGGPDVRTTASMPEVTFVSPMPVTEPVSVAPAPAASAAPVPSSDPLAPIMALSEDERIALFT